MREANQGRPGARREQVGRAWQSKQWWLTAGARVDFALGGVLL